MCDICRKTECDCEENQKKQLAQLVSGEAASQKPAPDRRSDAATGSAIKAIPDTIVFDDGFNQYNCSNCKTEGLEEWFSFCPCCGKVLEWEE